MVQQPIVIVLVQSASLFVFTVHERVCLTAAQLDTEQFY